MFSNYIKRFIGALLIMNAGFACCVASFQAAGNGDVESLARILSEYGIRGIEAQEILLFKPTSTPLHIAARYGGVEALCLLLGRGADVNARDKLMRTPLHEAIVYKHVPAVQILVAHDADIEAKDFMKKSPLYMAAERRLIDVVKLLINSGAQVDTGWEEHLLTPLHRAAENGDHDTAVFLVQHGADVNAEANHCSNYATPLKKAIQGRNIDLVKFLIHYGAIVVYDRFDDFSNTLLEKQLQSHFRGYDWRTDKAAFQQARKEFLMNIFVIPGDLAKLILEIEGVVASPESEGDGYSSEDTE